MLRKFLAATAIGLAVADETWTIEASSDLGTWEGWGVSLAWWGKAFGNRDDLADIFFSLGTTKWKDQDLPGLGFNIARYNAGACSGSTYKSATMDTNITAARQMEGYWVDGASDKPTSSSWRWDVDANQRALLKKAEHRGANRFELFSNSPMWWMTNNKNPAGSHDGTSDNLHREHYADHVHYIGEIASYAKKHWDITFSSVEPFNEPSAHDWVGPSGKQEGCHFDVETMATIIPLMRADLDSRGLTSTLVATPDEQTYDSAVRTLRGLGPTATKQLGRVNVHGYQRAKGNRAGLHALASQAGLALWTSEYGDSDPSGATLVASLLRDFQWLRPTAWAYWQAVDGSGWGLIDGDVASAALGTPAPKYFCLAQFARHIRQGMRILNAGVDHAVAAYDAAGTRLVVVAVNWGDAQRITFDLSGFSTPGKSGQTIPRWSTQISNGNGYVSSPSGTVQEGTKFGSHFEKNQIQTFEVANVKI